MAGVNQVISLADDVARYLKACGKSSVLQTKPVNPSQLKGLHFAPEAIGETICIKTKTNATKNILSNIIEYNK